MEGRIANPMKTTMRYNNGRGKEVSREVNETINVRDYVGTASYPWLVIFANPHLSVADIGLFLSIAARENPGVERPESWIQRKRWMTRKPGEITTGPRASSDGRDKRAVAIMREHPTLSARKLVALLNERGITRNKDWILRHRCD